MAPRTGPLLGRGQPPRLRRMAGGLRARHAARGRDGGCCLHPPRRGSDRSYRRHPGLRHAVSVLALRRPRAAGSSTAAPNCCSTTPCSDPATRPGTRSTPRSPTAWTACCHTCMPATLTLLLVSRAPMAKPQAYKQRMGWRLPWDLSSQHRLRLRPGRLRHPGADPPGGLPPIVAQNAAEAVVVAFRRRD
jgi:Bacterial protein of unknown function (DUF899)